MKRPVLLRRLSALFSTTLLLGALAVPAFANSAQTWWEGVDATGAIVSGVDCPIIVEKEVLTFDAQEFPGHHYGTEDLDALLAYGGSVTAEYTFYNPADYTVTATLLFPFGALPDYISSFLPLSADTEQYDIAVDGSPIQKTLRHTLSSRFTQFSLEEDLALLHDGFVEDDFYSLDLPVTKYTFTAGDIDTEAYKAANAAFDVEPSPNRKVYFVEESGGQSFSGGTYRISAWVKNGDEYTVYIIGEDYETFPEWTFYENGGTDDGTEIDGTMTLTARETMTLKDLAMTCWSPDSGVSESDWYNAVIARMNQVGEHYGGGTVLADMTLNVSDSLMRWYQYEITLEPGQRIVNTVTAPVYPDVNGRYEPAVYTYGYLLSPAKTWAEFGELEIIINTSSFLTESNIEGFSKTGTGYSLTLPGLPDSELEFTLCASETPKMEPSSLSSSELLLLGVAVILFVALFIGLIVYMNHHKDQKLPPRK